MLSGGCFGWPAVLLDILTLPEIWGSSAESQSTIESLILIDQMSIAASVFTLVPGVLVIIIIWQIAGAQDAEAHRLAEWMSG